MKLLGIEMLLEEFDFLLCEQAKGKELVVEDSKVIARDRIVTDFEIKQNRFFELKNWFETTYRYKDEKYNRLIILDKLDDDGVSPEIKRKELYEEAENIRAEIQRLEEELNDGN